MIKKILKWFQADVSRPYRGDPFAQPEHKCPKCGHKYSKYDGWQGGPL